MNADKKMNQKDPNINRELLKSVIEISPKTRLRFSFCQFLKSIFSSRQQMTLEEWDRLESKPQRSKANHCPTFSKYF